MKSAHHSSVVGTRAIRWLAKLATLATAFIFALSAPARAGTPAPSSGKLAGIYKVSSSTDPLFPASRTREYFLDFGKGIQSAKLSGSVAVSERRNPSVKIRIMAWQYFPDQGTIVLGNPFAEGSRNAVAKAAWRMKNVSEAVVFQRGDYQVVLRPADPKDY
jgi:hypothetical protein